INVLTGDPAEMMPWLATHADVNAIDLAGITDGELAVSLERDAAGTVKRVRRPDRDPDWSADPGLSRIRDFVETKTVWHPMGV
ncbi:MAG: aldehyde dehydrogenase, partial [Actinobacteria bacterium]|nr:aldehyde dehydrogenase [Actinomycetota bacterium]